MTVPLEPGDVVRAIDGRPVDDWVAGGRAVADRTAGETITYEPCCPPGSRPRARAFRVTLTPVPAGRRRRSHAATLVGRAGPGRAREPLVLAAAQRAPRSERSLAAAALAAAGGSHLEPLGLGVIDLAGVAGHLAPVPVGRPRLRSGWAAASSQRSRSPGPPLRPPPARSACPRRCPAARRVRRVAPRPGPRLHVEAARLEATATVVPPALVVAVPAIALAPGATRAATTGRAAGGPPGAAHPAGRGPPGCCSRPSPSCSPATRCSRPRCWCCCSSPAALAGIAVAVDGYRLEAVEPTVRRAMVRGFATSLVARALRRPRRRGRPGSRTSRCGRCSPAA